MRICVVVLGDIGRSPRMQYQSLSLAEQGHVVDILGYGGSPVLAEVKSNDNIRVHHLPLVPAIPVIRMRLLTYLWKTIWQFFTLWFAMVKLGDCFDTVLVQNPPAIPTLVICWLYCFTYCKKFIIDWHNYAYTLMGEKCDINSKPKRILVRIAKFIEFHFGRKAQLNFCVSKAMQRHLKCAHGIESIVLYDQPNEIFQPITTEKQIKFLTTLSENRSDFRIMHEYLLPQEDSSRKYGLIISSTSWTEDEDFNILLTALKVYEKRAANESSLPNLLCIITGKGPLKSYFQSLIRKQSYWDKVKFVLPWLDSAEYPLLLACADLGICLHTSSSGLDLPMKVLDMFGCALPVLAYDYKCLSTELVKVDLCGYTFADDKQLADRLINWFTDYPKNSSTIETQRSFKDHLIQKYEIRWKQYWIKTVGKYFPAEIPISSGDSNN